MVPRATSACNDDLGAPFFTVRGAASLPIDPPTWRKDMSNAVIRFALAPLGALLLAPAGAAEPPQTLFLERAQTQASGGQVRAYGVPTTDAQGTVLYWDLSIDLTVGANGKPAGNATVTSVKQPKVRTNRIVPGKYADAWGNPCTMNTATLADGRQEASGSCSAANGVVWNFSAVSGDLAGHPFELQLRAAGIDQIAGYRDYHWGVDGATSTGYYGCFWTNHIVAVRQVGAQVVVTNFGNDNISDCGGTLSPAP
jgi:hypothetical protein